MLCMCFVALQMTAQDSYFMCDFEDEAQNAKWSLVNGSYGVTTANKWNIGSAVSNGGEKSMYMSVDSGRTVSYYNLTSYIITYTDVHLHAGTYDLSFDWRAMGNITENSLDGLYVYWGPVVNAFGDTIKLNSNNSNELSKELQQYLVEVSPGDTLLRGSATWKNCVTTVKTYGVPYRLAFIWMIYGLDVVDPGPSIDNIMILDTKSCPSPTALDVRTEGARIELDWVGNADAYEVKCYSYTSDSWIIQTVYDTTSIAFTNVPEGLCDFYVSAICDEKVKSVPTVRSEYFVYYPVNHCIDYLTLDSTNCYIANEKVSDRGVDKLTWTNFLVNDGYASKASRHTIHYAANEYDPRTCNELRTVPEGELASVRLGNWDTGSEAERVEFKFHVDAKVNPVLVLKYAVVLEKPNPTCLPNPGFLLRVLDERGRLVSDCASADFDFQKAAEADWELCDRNPDTGNITEIRWKDWTTVGVNLADFDGQTLTIQLTTYDCGGGGHYGYAYFTLGCSDGKLSGMTCGVENTQFVAPAGFVYQWYLQNDPDSIVGHEQVLEVLPTDTNHYVVDMMFAQDSSCYFSLVASAQPYQPFAAAQVDYMSVDCQNVVQFTNLSHVIETNQITDSVTHTTKTVDWVEWDFGDGKPVYEENPRRVFDSQGGPIQVKLIAHLATCVDTLVITDTLPAIGTTRDTLSIQQCVDVPYVYSYTASDNSQVDTTLTETGMYDFTLKSKLTGCDSIVTINLLVLDTLWTYIDTLIIKGDTLQVGNQLFTKTGEYKIPLQSEAGCDSVVVLNLTVHDYLVIEALQEYTICHGESSFLFGYAITQGYTKDYSLTFANDLFASVEAGTLEYSNAIDIAIPADAIPNTYDGEVSFIDTIGGNVVVPFQLHILYNQDVVTQRWNDVLAVRNSDYNGGFEFDKYQWYKKATGESDFAPLQGDTLSYLYEPLDPTSAYAVGLVRKGETVEILTCEIYPEDYSEVSIVPTLVEKSQPMQIVSPNHQSMNGEARWMMFSGATIATQSLVDGTGLVAPATSGLFLLILQDQSGEQTVLTIQVR